MSCIQEVHDACTCTRTSAPPRMTVTPKPRVWTVAEAMLMWRIEDSLGLSPLDMPQGGANYAAAKSALGSLKEGLEP